MGHLQPIDPKYSVDPRLDEYKRKYYEVQKKTRSTSPLWQDKLGKKNKAVQVYEDVLTQKYKWKKETATKMIQTDDLNLEQLALDQYNFRQSSHFHKYYQYTIPPAPREVQETLKSQIFGVKYDEDANVSRVMQDVYATSRPSHTQYPVVQLSKKRAIPLN